MLGTAASSMHHQGGQAGADRDRKIGRGDLLQVELDHHVLGDLAPFGGPVLQPVEPVLHLGNPGFEACCQGFVSEGRADNGGDDLVQISQSLDRIGEGLLIDGGIFRSDAVAEGSVGYGGKLENSWHKLQITKVILVVLRVPGAQVNTSGIKNNPLGITVYDSCD